MKPRLHLEGIENVRRMVILEKYKKGQESASVSEKSSNTKLIYYRLLLRKITTDK
jgi:hypothetical protein